VTNPNETHFMPPAPAAHLSAVNLTELLKSDHKYKLSVEPETSEERTSRLRVEEADAKMKRVLTLTLFIFAILIVGVIFGSAIYTLLTGGADDKKWAVPLVTLIASGLVGFLVGKATAK
jgi:hypothetical protein